MPPSTACELGGAGDHVERQVDGGRHGSMHSVAERRSAGPEQP
jgi:hypothetical protein